MRVPSRRHRFVADRQAENLELHPLSNRNTWGGVASCVEKVGTSHLPPPTPGPARHTLVPWVHDQEMLSAKVRDSHAAPDHPLVLVRLQDALHCYRIHHLRHLHRLRRLCCPRHLRYLCCLWTSSCASNGNRETLAAWHCSPRTLSS